MQKDLNTFRKVAFWEGISFLVLLFIAMPLKYFGNIESATTIVGYMHGFLFLLFLVFMIITGTKYKWGTGIYVMCVLASVFPFGTFILDSSFLKPLSKK